LPYPCRLRGRVDRRMTCCTWKRDRVSCDLPYNDGPVRMYPKLGTLCLSSVFVRRETLQCRIDIVANRAPPISRTIAAHIGQQLHRVLAAPLAERSPLFNRDVADSSHDLDIGDQSRSEFLILHNADDQFF
ncbi:hypothetical protein, partial [Burkholderia cepacia]|uniref:hypothetical protein n=1 Tax=Burkholderia cepacia TaxID=292 RepID=UPI001C894277